MQAEQPPQTLSSGSSNAYPQSPEPFLLTRADAIEKQIHMWLDLSTAREQRRFLENHHSLLAEQSERILCDLLAQAPEGSAQTKLVRDALILLQDAQRRGGTTEAIREAYIHIYGGFVLDLPSWLEAVEQRLIALLNEKRDEETAEARVELLQKALEGAQREAVSPELLATLRRELANAWWKHAHTDRARALEIAITFCEEALQTFTVTRYPYQYAQTQQRLGTVYWQRMVGERKENLERAIACYQEILRVREPDIFPLEYAEAQNNLGLAYGDRIAGERRENLELAIACHQEALRIRKPDVLPFEYARTQNNLGIAYQCRIAGSKRENLKLAIVCYQEVLRVWTLDVFPFEYAIAQNNLGEIYREYGAGERRENQERAIACFHEALRVWTLDAFPFYYALTQNNLGKAYAQRITGEKQKNLELAIICHQKALRVHTLNAHPLYYAEAQNNLGLAYGDRIVGGKQENLELAIACFHEALNVYTIESYPYESRDVHANLAETEAQRQHWHIVQNAYTAALRAEDLLVILGAGTLGRDAILKEGRDAASRLGYALHRLGHVDEAAIVIERGRARGLAEAITFDAADPALITDEERRSRYIAARAALITVQADLHTPLPQNLDENTRRRLDLERTAAYRSARSTFDALVEEIRVANDPSEFLHDSLDAATILLAAQQIGPGHALVYLVATPWGGVAVAALSEQRSSTVRFATLDLPDLTEAWINTLIEARLQDDSEQVIGGFALAQMGEGFERLCQQGEGETFQAKANAFHNACQNIQQDSTLDHAIQAAMACPPFAALAEQSLAQLSRQDHNLMEATFNAFFLQSELAHCLKQLSTNVFFPLITWLQEQETTSLTLIPCGQLAAFPLAAVVLPDERSVGEMFPTSIAPSARSLLRMTSARSPQAGIATLGDPRENLSWSEAEALAFTTLARQTALPVEIHLKKQATREHLLTALRSRWVVNACCHGTFDSQDFLQSALLLAGKERVTMSEMLNHHADLRGLRLLLLSACQTALLDLQGARDEVHSLAVAMLQAGAQAVIAAQWAVDDKATYLLMVRFAQEWLPQMEHEPPAAALARAQAWLRCVTNQELAHWQSEFLMPARMLPGTRTSQHRTTRAWQHLPVRGRSARWQEDDAQLIVRFGAEGEEPSARSYTDPYYWAGFQVIGW